MARNDIKNSSLLKTKFLIYAFNGRTKKTLFLQLRFGNDAAITNAVYPPIYIYALDIILFTGQEDIG